MAGGKSSRLGISKAFLSVHGEPQIDYLLHQFEELKIEAFAGVSASRKSEFDNYPLIEDEPGIPGPLASIVAALNKISVPWLILAVDMPFITSSIIEYLIQKRNPAKMATSFTVDGVKPEPMATLWEERSLEAIRNYISTGGNSPIEFLKQADVELVRVKNPDWIFNINTEEDLLNAKAKLSSSGS